MKTIALALALVACSKPAPQAPTPHAENRGCAFAHMLDAKAPCLLESAPVAGKPDVALVDFGRVLAYCTAGEGQPSCVPFADLRPKEPAKAEAAPSSPTPAATPAPTPAPAAATAKPEAPKKK